MTEVEASYVAGLFDGEGSVYLVARKAQGRRSHHFNPEMTLGNTDPELLESLVETTGNGAIYLDRPGGPNHKPMYRWLLQPRQIRHVLWQMLPYLRAKKRRAELMFEFFDLQRQADYGPVAWENVPRHLIERIIAVHDELKRLNHRGLTEPEPLNFSFGEGKERKRTCDEPGCDHRRYRGHDRCYQHWLATSEPISKTCEHCGESFTAILPKARFCSPKCQWRSSYQRRKADAMT